MVTAMRTLLAALVLSGLSGSACSLRPQPEPPPVTPGPEIDVDLLSVEPTSPAAMVGCNLSGAPGAAPAGATVRAYNLESNASPSVAVAADDGSFFMDFDAFVGDEEEQSGGAGVLDGFGVEAAAEVDLIADLHGIGVGGNAVLIGRDFIYFMDYQCIINENKLNSKNRIQNSSFLNLFFGLLNSFKISIFPIFPIIFANVFDFLKASCLSFNSQYSFYKT